MNDPVANKKKRRKLCISADAEDDYEPYMKNEIKNSENDPTKVNKPKDKYNLLKRIYLKINIGKCKKFGF